MRTLTVADSRACVVGMGARVQRRLWCLPVVVLLGVLLSACKREPPGFLALGGREYLTFKSAGFLSFNAVVARRSVNENGWIADIELLSQRDKRVLRIDLKDSAIDYVLVPSKKIRGDFDLEQIDYKYPDPTHASSLISGSLACKSDSFLHLARDERVQAYFLPDVQGGGQTKPSDVAEREYYDYLLAITGELVRDYPDDPYMRMLQMDAFRRCSMYDALTSAVATFPKCSPSTSDWFLNDQIRLLEDAVAARTSVQNAKNAWVLNEALSRADLKTWFAGFPSVLGCTEYDHGVLQFDEPNFLEYQVRAKVARAFLSLDALSNNRVRDFEIMSAMYYSGALMELDGPAIPQLIGIALRLIASAGLQFFELNVCDSAENARRVWGDLNALDERTSFTLDHRVRTDDPKHLLHDVMWLSGACDEQARIRQDRANALFSLTRFAAAVRWYRLSYGKLPSEGDTMFTAILSERMPMDPFTSKPLAWFSDGTTLTVYSFGPDRRDDGAELEFDVTKDEESDGDLVLRIPNQREYPFPTGGVRASSREDLLRQFPRGLPPDVFADVKGQALSVTRDAPVMVYSYGPDQTRDTAESAETYRPKVMYDPTNGLISAGDLFVTLPSP